MAKYDVRFSCGHEERIELLGKVSERERKIEWFMECGLCSKCYKEQQARKMAETHEEVEMHYGEYKNNYPRCKTKPDSYNKETKTIIVYIPKKARGQAKQ